MDATKGNGLTSPQSQPAKGHIKNGADFIALCVAHASRQIKSAYLFTVNLMRLKNISLALWVTDYEMASGFQSPDSFLQPHRPRQRSHCQPKQGASK